MRDLIETIDTSDDNDICSWMKMIITFIS